MDTKTRRQDSKTSATITEALNMRRAFGYDTALAFLLKQGVDKRIAESAVFTWYGRRRKIRRGTAPPQEDQFDMREKTEAPT